MKFLAIIPAREGSRRVKNKNIRNFQNKPLIFWTIKEAKKSKFINKIIVSTDSNKIKDISLKFGAEVPFLRPKIISSNNADTHSVILHTLNFLKSKELYIPDYVILLQPTSPLRNINHIDASIKKITKDKKADSLVSVNSLENNLHPSNLMKLNSKYLSAFMNKKKIINTMNCNDIYHRNGAAIYITKYPNIKEYILGGNIIHYKMDEIFSVDINTEKDFLKAEAFYKLIKKGILF